MIGFAIAGFHGESLEQFVLLCGEFDRKIAHCCHAPRIVGEQGFRVAKAGSYCLGPVVLFFKRNLRVLRAALRYVK